MTDRRLRVFYTVARLLSFTQAAKALHMTQPAVTFQIRQLEDHLSTRLFDRSHNRVVLTEAGRKVYEYAERIFELYGEMQEALRQVGRTAGGALTIGACHTAAESLLPALMRDFKRARPELNLGLKLAPEDEVLRMVQAGIVEAGIVAGRMEAALLDTRACLIDRSVVITQPGHPLAERERVRIEALAGYPLISREKGSPAVENIMRYAAANGVDAGTFNIALELGSLDAIKNTVEAGMGIAIVSRACVTRELELGSLACVGLDPPLERSFAFVCGPHKSGAAEELLGFARAYG
jgi:DNA-binding transcriptional LysR family regulator